MKDLKFRVWHKVEKKMYFRGYQKMLHVLLCEDDGGTNDWRGRPVKRASYEDCELLESTTYIDREHNEVYEGDIIRVKFKDKEFEDVVTYIPDMFGSKRLHPLKSVLEKHGIPGYPENLDVVIMGNRYETKPSASRKRRSG